MVVRPSYIVMLALACALPAFATVAVTAPSNGSTVGTAVQFAATATTTAWTTNGTVNDSTPNLVAVLTPTFQVTTTPNVQTQLLFGTSVDNFSKGIEIPQAGTVVQQVCLNMNGKSVLNITVQWQESP